ncbi:hypothetical protein BDW02DRAFT_256766 [Decorospora gaudefroyi]|uniref:Uncharacterized protein n=1 Tax=Decorospora gaudefroyi TaxID=184978 RepID=A0A6A5KK64_9PLEO|nr:hypothetical protein BDW02DRAFT_256766 [Decorospora gaudefroyi]
MSLHYLSNANPRRRTHHDTQKRSSTSPQPILRSKKPKKEHQRTSVPTYQEQAITPTRMPNSTTKPQSEQKPNPRPHKHPPLQTPNSTSHVQQNTTTSITIAPKKKSKKKTGGKRNEKF